MTKLSERFKLVRDNVQGVEDFDESEKKKSEEEEKRCHSSELIELLGYMIML